MSVKRVEFHQGASADVKNAVAWYRKRSPKAALDFIEELGSSYRHDPRDTRPLADGKEQHGTIPALAISVLHYLFRTRVRGYNLGRRSRQPTAGVLGSPPVAIARLFHRRMAPIISCFWRPCLRVSVWPSLL